MSLRHTGLLSAILLLTVTAWSAPVETVRFVLPPASDETAMTVREACLTLGLPAGFPDLAELDEPARRVLVQLAAEHRKDLLRQAARQLNGQPAALLKALVKNGETLGPDLAFLVLTARQKKAVLDLNAARLEAHARDAEDGQADDHYRIEYAFTQGLRELLDDDALKQLDKVLDARRATRFPKTMLDNPTVGRRVLARRDRRQHNGSLPHIVAVDPRKRQVVVKVKPTVVRSAGIAPTTLVLADGVPVAPDKLTAGRPVHVFDDSAVQQSVWLAMQVSDGANVQVIDGLLKEVLPQALRMDVPAKPISFTEATRYLDDANRPLQRGTLNPGDQLRVVALVDKDGSHAAVVRRLGGGGLAGGRQSALLYSATPRTLTLSHDMGQERTFAVAQDFKVYNYSDLLEGRRRAGLEDLADLVGKDVPLVGYWTEPDKDGELPVLRFGYLATARRHMNDPRPMNPNDGDAK